MIISGSDKDYWHDFIPTYLAAFNKLGPVTQIVELGVFNGGSIRWLRSLYPDAFITGVDILHQSSAWPQDERITYVQADQGKPQEIVALFDGLTSPIDLVIEDGSHLPAHQVSCLDIGLPRVRRGGLYILEDLHTAHPAHSYSQTAETSGRPNALNMLLAVQHLRASGVDPETWLSRLDGRELFTVDQARNVLGLVHDIDIYRRARLPRKCWSCGGSRYDYARLLCSCGTDLYAEADSMTAIITRK